MDWNTLMVFRCDFSLENHHQCKCTERIKGKMLGPDSIAGQGLYGKGNCNWICQYLWEDKIFLQIIQLPVYMPCIEERYSSYATSNGGDHVVHMLENSVISFRKLLANLNFDMKVNGSLCVLKFIWLGSWWLEVYRITTKHILRLRAYVNNLSYHMIAIDRWQFHTLRPRQKKHQSSASLAFVRGIHLHAQMASYA